MSCNALKVLSTMCIISKNLLRNRNAFTSVECFVHSGAFFVSNVELLIGDEKLGSDILAAVDLLLRISTLARKSETVLVSEVEHSLQR